MSVQPPPPSRSRTVLRAFGGGLTANFWKLWSSSAAANLADGITVVAIPLIAIRITTSPAEIAAVSVAAQVPALLLGLVAGGLADRLDRRWTMLVVQLLRVAVIATLAVFAIAGALSMPTIYAGAFIIGAGETFFDTNAVSILPSVVGRERLVTANGRLFAAETIMNSFVGPPLGGLLVALSVPPPWQPGRSATRSPRWACCSSWATFAPSARDRRDGCTSRSARGSATCSAIGSSSR